MFPLRIALKPILGAVSFAIRLAVFVALFVLVAAAPQKAAAQAYNRYTIQEIIDAGHGFFGATSGALAGVVERLFEKYGLPNGYILGQEAGAAFIGGLRYGEGNLYTKNAGDYKIYWQGPSVGWDYGIDGDRTMMLVYNLPTVDFVYQRYFRRLRLGLRGRRPRRRCAGAARRLCCADPHWRRRPARHQCWLPQDEPYPDLQSVLVSLRHWPTIARHSGRRLSS